MATPNDTGAFVTPEQIIADLWAPRATQVLVTAVELGLFTHLSAGARTVADVAASAGAPSRGVRHLLDALVALGYLDKEGADTDPPGRRPAAADDVEYLLTPESERFLVQDSPSYIGDMCRETRLLWPAWAQLTDVVRSGKPTALWEEDTAGRENFPQLVSAWFPLSFGAARAAVAALPEKTRGRIRRVLDVAAGSGAWSLAFATELPDVEVTTVDHPEVNEITARHADRFGVGDRYTYRSGNLRDVPFGDGYDVVTLGYIVHTEGPEWGRRLIERAYAALRDGGTLLIGDMIPDDDRTGPDIPLVFAATDLLLFSQHGNVFTMRDYRSWLTEAGFRTIDSYDVLAPSPLLVATK